MATAQVRFTCSQCNKQYSTPSSFAGKTVNCNCGMKLTVPSANAVAQPQIKPAVVQQPQHQQPQYQQPQYQQPQYQQPQPQQHLVSHQGPPPGVASKYCHACGQVVDARAEICPKCGVRQPDVDGPGGGSTEHKNKLVAALLAFLLGGIGAHHFYLGKPIMGVIYLLFCWTLIPSLVALIEGLVYLCMSDAAFARRYPA